MKTPHLFFAALLLATALPASAAAQEPDPSAPVDSLAWVRVRQHDAIPRRVTGVLFAADSQSVTVQAQGRGVPVLIPLRELDRMEVSLGRRTRGEGARRGAFHGFLGGAAASAVLLGLGAVASTDCGDCYFPPVVLAAVAAVPITAITTVGGALLGAAAPGEHWVRVRTPVVLRPPRP